jgi:hypothetical protein
VGDHATVKEKQIPFDYAQGGGLSLLAYRLACRNDKG